MLRFLSLAVLLATALGLHLNTAGMRAALPGRAALPLRLAAGAIDEDMQYTPRGGAAAPTAAPADDVDAWAAQLSSVAALERQAADPDSSQGAADVLLFSTSMRDTYSPVIGSWALEEGGEEDVDDIFLAMAR